MKRRRIVAVACVLLIGCAAGLYALWHPRGDAATLVRVVAAGDMVCDPTDPDLVAGTQGKGERCRHHDVARLAESLNPDVVLGLGDYQYETPTAATYRDVYGPTWGRLRTRTVPVLGNQEYLVGDARPFMEYFGKRVPDPRGYWSQDLGGWHVVVLNSNCSTVDGGCDDGSPQQQWLAKDLSAHHKCVLAAWHHPRWSTGIAGPDDRTAALYRTLYAHGVELLLSGHDSDYERFGPLDANGKPDPRGISQFVVGTGGEAHNRPGPQDRPWLGKVDAPASRYVDFDHHGVLELELRPGSWQWRFQPLAAPVADQGQGACT